MTALLGYSHRVASDCGKAVERRVWCFAATLHPASLRPGTGLTRIRIEITLHLKIPFVLVQRHQKNDGLYRLYLWNVLKSYCACRIIDNRPHCRVTGHLYRICTTRRLSSQSCERTTAWPQSSLWFRSSDSERLAVQQKKTRRRLSLADTHHVFTMCSPCVHPTVQSVGDI